MKLWPFGKKDATGLSIETVMRRFEAVNAAVSGISVTPETCMQSPTMQAIITAVSRRMSSLPIEVLRRTSVTEGEGEAKKTRVKKELLPNHPVAKLLKRPNDWQDPVQFWLDAASYFLRYGNFFAFKSRGQTGPIRALIPLNPGHVTALQDNEWNVEFRATFPGGGQGVYKPDQLMHARGASRDGVMGSSIVMDIKDAIGLDIQAERMGASVFANSAMPSIIFKFADGAQGFETDEERKQFVQDYQEAYSRSNRFRAMLLPEGIDVANNAPIDNEKAQYIATRQYQRTVIAAAFGIPPHMVGDLSRGTFNNVEQQSIDFTTGVILPIVRSFEAAMERALLTDEDRSSGVIIRFDLMGILRGDFKSRQEGLNIQRNAGIINANEWREAENMNPISDEDGGEMYWTKGQSGQGGDPAAQPATADDGNGGQAPKTEDEDDNANA
jgi:HK97 family phage portal protein